MATHQHLLCDPLPEGPDVRVHAREVWPRAAHAVRHKPDLRADATAPVKLLVPALVCNASTPGVQEPSWSAAARARNRELPKPEY
jgi:hypothetical protein